MGRKEDLINTYTYSSIVDEAINRKKHPICSDDSARQGTYSFTQTDSFEEAVDFARRGWDLGLEQYKIEDGLLVGGTTEMQSSVAGCLPHVQNVIIGYPETMYSLYDSREYNLPTLDIVVNLAYTAGNNGKDALEFGKSLVAFINKKASTRNIRITGVFASSQKDSLRVYDFITLKDFDSALVLNNIAFAFHPSFFRRIWFSILEGKEYWSWGYGSTIHNYKKTAEKYLEGFNADEKIFFKCFDNISRYKWDESHLSEMTM